MSSCTAQSAHESASAAGGTRAYGDCAEGLTDPDLVYLGAPHATHAALALQAISAGAHVLVERPMTKDAATARDLAAAARAAGVFLMEGMWTKFNAVVRRVVELVDAGEIGEVRSVRASFGLPFPRDEGSRWRADLGGSSLLDQGIYPFTLVRMMLGDPVGLHAGGSARLDGVDLTGHVTLNYSEGRFALVAWSMVEFTDLSAAISGTNGVVTLHPACWTPERATVMVAREGLATAPEVTEIEIPREGFGFVPMLQSVAESIAAGRVESDVHPMSETIATLVRVRALLRAPR